MSINGIGPNTAAFTPKPVNVVAHVDATEKIVEPYLAHRVDDFQQMAQSGIDSTVKVLRGGTTATKKTVSGLAKLATNLAIPAAGFAVGGPIGLGIGLLVDAGLFVGGFTRSGLGELMSAANHKEMLPDGDWKGSQVSQFGDAQLSGPRLENDPLSAEGLGNLVADHMKPGETNVLYLAGHGLGGHQTAGLKTGDLAKALDGAREKTGVAPDFVILESCLQGNLEALSSLRHSGGIAIVSEESLPAREKDGGLPLSKMMAHLTENADPATQAKAMISDAEKAKVPTLAAVDLDKIGSFADSLEPLGSQLVGELVRGNQKTLLEAMDKAKKFPNSALAPLERAMLHETDMGGFLDNLSKADNLSEETKQVVAKSRKLLDEAVLAKTGTKDYTDASGLSFQTRSGILDKNEQFTPLHESGLPLPWQLFLELAHHKDPKAELQALAAAYAKPAG